MLPAPTQPAAHLYLHVPFCARRCRYCDFAIAVRRTVPWQDYVAAIDRECRVRGLHADTGVLRTLYLGGGTPSHLGIDGVRALMDGLRHHVQWADDAEVTLEANPEDMSAAAVRAWRDAGINRLSLGVQSFDDAVLAWMHRVHDADAARRAVGLARDHGIDDISLDLIFAMPEGIDRGWRRDLDAALALRPDHLSLYGLTIESHTPFGRQQARGELREADERQYEEEFLMAHDVLGAAGYEHYEVSNYATPGKRARHNSAYWSTAAYAGLGPSAHGFDGQVRRWNHSAYVAWRDAVQAGRDPLEGAERLTEANRTAETVYLGLRTVDGLALHPGEIDHVARWLDAGWVRLVGGPGRERLVCTASGWLRLDALAADLTAFRSHS